MTWESVLKDALLEADKQLKLYQKQMIEILNCSEPILWEMPRSTQKTVDIELLKRLNKINRKEVAIVGTKKQLEDIELYWSIKDKDGNEIQNIGPIKPIDIKDTMNNK